MTIMVAEVYEAFIEAGVTETKAKEAAKVLSEQFVSKDSDLFVTKSEGNNLSTKNDVFLLNSKVEIIDKKITVLETEMSIVKKMLWIVIGGIIALVFKAYFS